MQLLLIALLILGGGLASGQQYAFVKTETPVTGAAMIEDDQGALWIGGDEGIFRFDGTRVRQIDIGMGKKQHVTRSLAKSEDGAIWATSLGGLFRIQRNGTVTLERQGFGIGVDIRGPYVAHVEGDGNGGSLALGEYGNGKLTMFRYDAIHFDGPPKFASDGALIGACGDSICELSAGEVAKGVRGAAPTPQSFPLPVKGFGRMTAFKDESGCLWFRSMARGGYRCPGDQKFQLLSPDIAEISDFNSMTLGPQNQIWIVNDAGVLSYGRPGKFTTLRLANGVPRNIQKAYHGKDGSAWLTGPGFLARLVPPAQLELWTEKNGVTIEPLTVRRGGDGRLLIGGSGGLLALSQDHTKWEPFGDQKEMRHVRDLYPTPLGTTLVSSSYSGVMEFDGNGTLLRRISAIVTRFGPDTGNRVWTSGWATKLLQFGPQGLQFLDVPANLEIRSGSDFVRDQRGRLWHCTPEGLLRLDPGAKQWRKWGVKDGLPSPYCRSIEVSPSGDQLWFMNQSDAMSKLDFSSGDVPKFTHFNATDGDHFGFFIKYDKRGRLWRGGEGVHVSDGQRLALEDWVTLNEWDGLPSSKNEENRLLYADTVDDSVWVVSPQAVHHYRPPADLFTRRRTPNVFLSAQPPPEVKKGRPVQFDFGSLYFEARNQLRFRYRLKPDQPWIFTKETAKTFENLAPGDYHFELAARVLPAGEWTLPVTHDFRVVAPLWQTPTALGLTGAFSLGSITLVWGLGKRKRALYQKQKQAFLDALDGDRKTTDPDVERLLKLSKTPTHLPDLSPWQDHGTRGGAQQPREIDHRFEVDCEVASGGFATVYRARDRFRDGAWSAVKIFHLSQHEREWMLKRFQQEIESLKRIDHPNVVRFLSAGETHEQEPFLAMDFIDGETLRRKLSDGPIDRPRVAALVLELGAALHAIHQASVFHRDIKPENLMVTPEGRLVVIDFSIAIARDPRATQHALSRAAGSFLYMAPEQVFGFATPATDIYKFALVVFEMLTGKRAGDLGLGAASGSLPGEVVRSMQEFCPDLAPADILAEALVVEVRNRPQDALHFAERLADWLRS